ncbi:DUF4399 domain-containing protein [Pseudomonas gingeri]|uniref:DUF4399 domain-containing protein n=1 Tax=Pseudomonas gingeri TaxID=117681 RepID=A0A7Y7XH10_9PSED|nr:DUF4399 domain-containing protein [Pseudomonas gingeri]NWA29459.1 DUF4399 domain-containing protein [Pseudomonas gingeri]NWB99411.1 DUF4399 domain-containing protein [Pseudomonas gingeri]
MNTLVSRIALATVLLGSSMLALADDIPRVAAPEGAKVFIVSPKDGATVGKTFTVKFGMKGLTLKPAGDLTPGSGHHHLLVDQTALPDPTLPIPATDTVIHYGKAQTETQLTLTPGKHTLQLVAGDKGHMQFDPTVASKTITVNVK